MSKRVFARWGDDFFQHTLPDDLESVIWVLLYETLRSLDENLTDSEQKLLDRLTDGDLSHMEGTKSQIRPEFADQYIVKYLNIAVDFIEKL